MKLFSFRKLLPWLAALAVLGTLVYCIKLRPLPVLAHTLGRQVMELFAKVAHERQAGVLVVTHDSRTLDVFDRILDVEDGRIQIRANHKIQESRAKKNPT